MPDRRTRAEKLRDMASHPRSNPNEAENARRRLAEMGAETQSDADFGRQLRSERAGRRTAYAADDTIADGVAITYDPETGMHVFIDGIEQTDSLHRESVTFSW